MPTTLIREIPAPAALDSVRGWVARRLQWEQFLDDAGRDPSAAPPAELDVTLNGKAA